MILKLLAAGMMLILTAPAFASHTEPHSTGWFEYQWNEEDDAVLYCNALNYITVSAGVTTHEGDEVSTTLYIHDRPGPGAPYGTGLVSDGGGGTWVWQESNGIPGLQVHFGSGPFLLPDAFELLPFEWLDPPLDPCANGDTVIF